MATIAQILSVSYPAVHADRKKAANQWKDSTFMDLLDKQGALMEKSFGSLIEAPLDYRRNQGAKFLTTDLEGMSLTKTEVITTSQYDIAEIAAPIVWSNKDEVQNPSDNQKIALVSGLLDNGFDTHDDMVEEALFATSTNGFLGLQTHITTAGTGTDGTIDSSLETWWRNKTATYTDDTDIEPAFTTVWNAVSKGSGSKMKPTLLVSDGATNALFEGTQQALQRYGDQDFRSGAKTIYFKTAPYAFSQFGTTSVYFLNSKAFTLQVAKGFYRRKSETKELDGANGYRCFIYSAMQTVVNNRSRLGVAHL